MQPPFERRARQGAAYPAHDDAPRLEIRHQRRAKNKWRICRARRSFWAGRWQMGLISRRLRIGRGMALATALQIAGGGAAAAQDRSEEHTSELQSPMRNSYAVFC